MKTWLDIFVINGELVQKIESTVFQRENVTPNLFQVYRAFHLTPLEDVKVVILGQDPYPNEGNANGLAFSVNREQDLPRSLVNIFKELKEDIGVDRTNGDLSDWAKQGILLLNSCLTTEIGSTGAHSDLQWEKFTDKIIEEVSNKGNVVFILWGRKAQEKTPLIKEGNLVIKSSHPSPLAAHKGFFGSKPFSKTNFYLKKNGHREIKW